MCGDTNTVAYVYYGNAFEQNHGSTARLSHWKTEYHDSPLDIFLHSACIVDIQGDEACKFSNANIQSLLCESF